MPIETPPGRVRALNDRPVRSDGEHVLYWMTANRRPHRNFALQWAAEQAEELGVPLIVLEPLRAGYRWASDRHHAFVLQGMADNRGYFAKTNTLYHPYVEPEPGAGQGLLRALAARACAVVTDDWPCFFLPRMQAAAAKRLDVRLDAVDSNGLYPMRATERVFTTAASLRRHLQKQLPPHLSELPRESPVAGRGLPEPAGLPREVERQWPAADDALLEGTADALASLPIDHAVAPVPDRPGGWRAARAHLDAWLDDGFPRYADGRNQPEDDTASGLSPWLHFGHLSAHEVFLRVAEREGWSPDELCDTAHGSREGWWGMSKAAEAFLDELVTWREIGFNMCSHRDDYHRYGSLPDFAQQTLSEHAADPREHVYSLAEFEEARTHDELWNAAQNQLRASGRIHNYLRMLWGKKILEWTASPQDALDVMVELNNKYALDGRDPNSYSGIFWTLGRYDRAWGPERRVFGKVRYMSSENTAKKVRVKDYVARWNGEGLFA